MSRHIISSMIAMVAHEANRAYCHALGDDSQPGWSDAPKWQQDSIQAGVDMHLANPGATPADSHASWLAQKEADGWTYGEVKDADKKEHPCFMPYDELPAEQKAKDYIFRAVVHAVAGIADAVGNAPAAVIEVSPDKAVVRYIGNRESWTDRLYGSGLAFHKGQARAVPLLVAAKLLRHADVFEAVADGQADLVDDTDTLLQQANKDTEAVRREQEALQDLRESIQVMDKEALDHFAKSNYRQDLNKRLSVNKLREQVVGLVDQYGAA